MRRVHQIVTFGNGVRDVWLRMASSRRISQRNREAGWAMPTRGFPRQSQIMKCGDSPSRHFWAQKRMEWSLLYDVQRDPSISTNFSGTPWYHISMKIQSVVINLYPDGQTDRQTETCTDSHAGRHGEANRLIVSPCSCERTWRLCPACCYLKTPTLMNSRMTLCQWGK